MTIARPSAVTRRKRLTGKLLLALTALSLLSGCVVYEGYGYGYGPPPPRYHYWR